MKVTEVATWMGVYPSISVRFKAVTLWLVSKYRGLLCSRTAFPVIKQATENVPNSIKKLICS